jgi:hypothetical protein
MELCLTGDQMDAAEAERKGTRAPLMHMRTRAPLIHIRIRTPQGAADMDVPCTTHTHMQPYFSPACTYVHTHSLTVSLSLSLWAGLVSKVVPGGKVLEEALQLGERIAQFSKPVVGLCKESVNAGQWLPVALELVLVLVRVRLPVCLSVCLPICLSVCLSVYVCICMCMCVCMCVCVYVCMHVCV